MDWSGFAMVRVWRFAMAVLCFSGNVFDITGCVCRFDRWGALGVHMKANGAKHSLLKELFFPGRGETEEAVPNRVARWTSVFWVAHFFAAPSTNIGRL